MGIVMSSMSVRTFIKYIFCLAIISLFTGCTGAMGPKPEELVAKQYNIYEGSQEKIKLSKPGLLINNDGSVSLSNGEIIMDEEGSILNAIQIDEKIFYVVYNKNLKILKLKEKNGNLLKSFENTFKFRTFNYNGNLYIATASQVEAMRYTNNVYSNLFKFDGTAEKLIKKNVVIDGYTIAGLDATAKLSEYDYKINGSTLGNDYLWEFYNILDGKKTYIKPSLVPQNGYSSFSGKEGYKYSFIAGFVGDTVVYIYNYKFNNNAGQLDHRTILEAQNLVTGKVVILLDNGEQVFSFLSNGEDVVFKQGDRLIDLRTLKSALIDNNFMPVRLKTGYKNMGGGINWSTFEEYSSNKLLNARGQGKYLFIKE